MKRCSLTWVTLVVLMSPLFTSGCWTECCDEPQEDTERPIVVRPGPTRESPDGRTTPLPSDRSLDVRVDYLLTDDLGTDQTAIVEAFDNPWFRGSPVTSVRMTGFDASHPGTSAVGALDLGPGEYYLRAYLALDDGPPAPYSYEGMDFVSDRPFGLYGALSGATRIVVSADDGPENVRIQLDKLFKSPDAELPTRAHVRVIIRVDPEMEVRSGQKVLIRLHRSPDFTYSAAYEFSLATEALRVEGSKGRAEYVSGELELGEYFVVAFLDLTGNGFHDEGEPWQVYRAFGETASVLVDQDRTVTVDLKLEIQGESPEDSLEDVQEEEEQAP